MIGRLLGHYEIVEKLGEGGMGVVYKGHDRRLNRFAAIKILPEDRMADAGRKQRFAQEARAASALSHPNIVHVYDIGESDGVDFIAMEFVAGRTLDRLIPRLGMQPREALRYAVQIADALAKAHAAGIVHRDLKPGNVMVSDQGFVKLLDFGLAKLTEPSPGLADDATRTFQPALTEEGAIAGTAAYMSPEQAEGKPVDARSDIFSFGALLYEMLTGRRAFQGETKASILAAILRDEPTPASEVVKGVSPELDRILKRCLRKDPAQRIRHMDDLKLALEELKFESDSTVMLPARARAGKMRSFRLGWAAAGAVLLAAVVGAGVWFARSSTRAPEPELAAVPLTAYPGTETSPSFSPDGMQAAFAWCKDTQANECGIYVKQIGVEPPARLTAAATDCCPAWSPDGRSIAFLRRLRPNRFAVILIPQRGGSERVLAEYDVAGASIFTAPGEEPCAYLAWTPDSKRLAYPEAEDKVWSLFLLSVETGEKRRLTHPGADALADAAPAFSPDGRMLVFSRQRNDVSSSDLYLLRLGKGYAPEGEPEKVRLSKPRNLGAAWLPSGGEIVFSSGTENSFGLWRMALPGPSTPRRLAFAASNASAPAISPQLGRLAFVVGREDSNIWRVSLENGRTASPPVQLIASTRADSGPSYSPDGQRIAFLSERSGASEIWVSERDGSNPVLLTSSGLNPLGPRWSWDGRNIAYGVTIDGRPEVYVIGANGGASRRVETSPGGGKWPYWSRDGRSIYFAGEAAFAGIWKMPVSGGQAVRLTRDEDDLPQESPDGKFVYYMKGWPYQVALWKMPAEGGQAVKVLDSVHHLGQWEVGARGIYYFAAGDDKGRTEIRLYEFAGGATKKIATVERPLVDALAISPDGRTILYSQSDEAGSDLMLVENFR